MVDPREIAHRHGLPPDAATRLVGTDATDLELDALRLRSALGYDQPPRPPGPATPAPRPTATEDGLLDAVTRKLNR